MSNILSVLVFLWFAVASYLTSSLIGGKAEECGAPITDGDYIEDVVNTSMKWPLLVFVDKADIEGSKELDCSMTLTKE